MYLVTQIRNFFQCKRPLTSLQKVDGVALGTMIGMRTQHVSNEHSLRLLWHGCVELKCLSDAEAARSHKAVILLLTASEAMKKFATNNPWFVPMLNAVLEGKLKPSLNLDVPRDILTEADGRKLGQYLIPSLAVNIHPSAGVHEWIYKYPALQEIAGNVPWFEAFIVEISHG